MSTEKKADFSGVTATVDSTEQKAADFSGVTATVDSTEEIVGERTYTIEKGDTLSKIAKEQLGSANAWKKISKPTVTCWMIQTASSRVR